VKLDHLRISVIAALSLSIILITGAFPLQSVFAQEVGGGVNIEGDWHVGEGLQAGDYFSYQLCHVDYRECSTFQLDFWIEGEITTGSEQKWLAQTVVYDRNKVVTGTMELGKIAPEPTGGSPELGPYRSAFKTSIVWLSAFSTANDPKAFSLPSWGKIANIGGQQVKPSSVESVSVPAGTFESVLITWYTGGYLSKVWLIDEFPFPVRAETFTHVSEGIAPPEYQFQLLDFQENVQQNPFEGIISTIDKQKQSGCPEQYDLTSIKKTSKNFQYLLDIRYGPSEPLVGCEIEWFINFKKPADETEFLNQVQYDIFVVDDNLTPLRSIADDLGRQYLYSPSGQVLTNTLVDEPPGIAHYVIWIYGLSPEGYVPSTAPDYLEIDIPISSNSQSPIMPPSTEPELNIPSWIKTNAGWWEDGLIDDNSFVQGIQFLIKEGIMKIPQTSQGSSTGSDEIPAWIKTNAGWWEQGLITDNDFVQGIQFLIENGIMRIS
jgi:hypothetical protein